MTRRAVVLTAPDGTRVVWAKLRGATRDEQQERHQLMRARDWARRMYGQDSPSVETVRIEVVA